MSGLVAAALHGVDERRVAGRMPQASNAPNVAEFRNSRWVY